LLCAKPYQNTTTGWGSLSVVVTAELFSEVFLIKIVEFILDFFMFNVLLIL